MKRVLLFTLALSLLLSLCAFLTGCAAPTSGLTKEEIRTTVSLLADGAAPINVPFFGEGLPAETDMTTIAAFFGVSEGSEIATLYLPVDEAAPFRTEAELRAAALRVYSPAVCEEILFPRGFDGVRTEEDERIVNARYIERNGILTVQRELSDVYPVQREFDFDKMVILVDEEDRIRVEVPSFVEGEASVLVRITLVLTDAGWRLDSPTY